MFVQWILTKFQALQVEQHHTAQQSTANLGMLGNSPSLNLGIFHRTSTGGPQTCKPKRATTQTPTPHHHYSNSNRHFRPPPPLPTTTPATTSHIHNICSAIVKNGRSQWSIRARANTSRATIVSTGPNVKQFSNNTDHQISSRFLPLLLTLQLYVYRSLGAMGVIPKLSHWTGKSAGGLLQVGCNRTCGTFDPSLMAHLHEKTKRNPWSIADWNEKMLQQRANCPVRKNDCTEIVIEIQPPFEVTNPLFNYPWIDQPGNQKSPIAGFAGFPYGDHPAIQVNIYQRAHICQIIGTDPCSCSIIVIL